MPTKTEAAILWEQGAEWSVEEVEIDDPHKHEVLVKLAASGLCHSDEHLVTGDIPAAMPVIGGHEGAGEVVAVGEGVDSVKPGDHVVLGFIPSCGNCKWCSIGKTNLCDLGAHLMMGVAISDGTHRIQARGQGVGTMCLLGTFSPYANVHQSSVIKIDDDIPLDKAALVGCGVTTGWGSAVYVAEVKPGDTVAVIGCGGIGANAIQGARMAGAKHIVAVDPVEFKREKAQEFGATHAVENMDKAFALINDLTRGQLAEKAIITVGVAEGEMIAPAMSLVGKAGTVVVTAISPMMNSDVKMSLFELAMYQKTVKGNIFGGGSPRADIPKLLGLYQSGDLKLDELVTNTYKLADINQGYADMRDGKNIRGMVLYD